MGIVSIDAEPHSPHRFRTVAAIVCWFEVLLAARQKFYTKLDEDGKKIFVDVTDQLSFPDRPEPHATILHVSWGQPTLPPRIITSSEVQSLVENAKKDQVSESVRLPVGARDWLVDSTQGPPTYYDYVSSVPRDKAETFKVWTCQGKVVEDYDKLFVRRGAEVFKFGARTRKVLRCIRDFEHGIEEALGYSMEELRGKGHPLCRLVYFVVEGEHGAYWARADWIRALHGLDAIFNDFLFRIRSTPGCVCHIVVVTGQPGIGMLNQFQVITRH